MAGASEKGSRGAARRPVAFVIQRFGADVAGGAEAHCRRVALRLAETGRAVEVWTTTALDYRTWENHYPPGPSRDGALTVRRFRVDRPREPGFDDWTARILAGGKPPMEEQLRWLEAQGPVSSGLLRHVEARAPTADALIFYTYLYWPTVQGLAVAPEKSVLVPTLHDEPVAGLSIFRKPLESPRALLFLTPEEEAFARRRFRLDAVPSRMLATAVDPPPPGRPPGFSLRDSYLLYLGRVDAGKGALRLAEQFIRFVGEHGVRFPGTQLLFCGRQVMEPVKHRRIRTLGFQPEAVVAHLLRHATVLVMPSPFESLSMAVLEAMAAGVPVLANAASPVLVGHCRRSNGGLYYRDDAEFGEALALLLSRPGLRKRMGSSGRAYVEAHYSWPRVVSALEWAISACAESEQARDCASPTAGRRE